MAIASGARCKIAWKAETSYGVAPTGDWTELPFTNEALDESINTLRGNDIRATRSVASIRGGNIATSGAITHDFGLSRSLPWFAHLLATTATRVSQGNGDTVPNFGSVSGAITKGTIVKGNTGATHYYMATAAGTMTGNTDGDLTGTVAGTEQTVDSVAFKCLGPVSGGITPKDNLMRIYNLAGSTAYNRGDYVCGGSGNNWYTYQVVRGGTTGSVTAASLTVTTVGARQTLGTLVFECVGQYMAAAHYVYRFTASTDFPVGGLAIEKAILGGNTALYIRYLGCRINSLEMTMPQEGIITVNWGVSGQKTDTGTTSIAGTPVSEGESPAVGYNGFIHINDTNYQGAAANVGVWREGSISINNNLDESVYVVGDRYRLDLPAGQRTVTGRASCYFQDGTYYDYFKNETVISLGMSFAYLGQFFRWETPEVKLTGSASPKVSGPGVIAQDFEWSAFQGTSSYDVQLYAVVTDVALAL